MSYYKFKWCSGINGRPDADNYLLERVISDSLLASRCDIMVESASNIKFNYYVSRSVRLPIRLYSRMVEDSKQ